MDTDQLTRRLHEASEPPFFEPDVPGALRRASRLRRGRVAGSAVAVAVLATGVVTGVGALRSTPGAGTFAASPGGAAASGGVDFTLRYAPKDVCGLDIVLPAGSSPAAIGLPCYDSTLYPELGAPPGRTDYGRLPGEPVRLINSGTAPATTVAVLAVSQVGQPLTATLRTLPETGEVVWVMQSDGNRISDLHVVLADGRRSQGNSVTAAR